MFDWQLERKIVVRVLIFAVGYIVFREINEMADNIHIASDETVDEKRDASKNYDEQSIGGLDMLTASNSSKTAPKTADNNQKMYSSYMRRSESYGHMSAGSEAHVLVIYTGGTIGMMRNENNG